MSTTAPSHEAEILARTIRPGNGDLPAEVAWLPFQIDHIIPEKLHGQTVPENLVVGYLRASFIGSERESLA